MCRFNGFQKMGSGLLTGLLALSLCACSGRNQSQSATSNANVENANVESDSNAALFEAEISALAEDETLIHTAIIETNGAALLLTAAEIGSDGTTTECDVYAIVDEKVEKVGQLQSSGTAYPIAYDETWLYSASPHELRCYQMDETTGKLELKKRPFVQFDTEGNATYFLMQGEEETEITEDEYEVAYDEVYSNATVVVFS